MFQLFKSSIGLIFLSEKQGITDVVECDIEYNCCEIVIKYTTTNFEYYEIKLHPSIFFEYIGNKIKVLEKV